VIGVGTSQVSATKSTARVESLAAQAGATDLFVFRRVEPRSFEHIGGVGRGAGWAGVVAIGLAEEPLFVEALESGAVVRRYSPVPWHVVGPYYGRAVAMVRVSDDIVTLFGSATPEMLELGDAELRELACGASESIGEVAPAKRLADELEVVSAIRDLLALGSGTFAETIQGVVEHARKALSCDLGVIAVSEPRWIAVSDPVGRLPVVPGELCEVMDAIAARPGFPLCIQNARSNPLPAPFAPEDGVVAYYVVELTGPVSGLLLLAHREAASRGFTLLCQALALRLVDAAGVLFETALSYDTLRDELARSNREARSDALTGLANRFAWDEALSGFVCASDAASVVQIDCRGLKHANETHGHDVGDQLLRRVAELVASSVGEDDLVARIGGDEFAVLLRHADELRAAAVCERVLGALEREPPIASSVSAAVVIGAATTRDGNLAGAQKQADTRMRDAKRLAALL
jgi:diguanylate cyclase (GGDEF)-like protein